MDFSQILGGIGKIAGQTGMSDSRNASKTEGMSKPNPGAALVNSGGPQSNPSQQGSGFATKIASKINPAVGAVMGMIGNKARANSRGFGAQPQRIDFTKGAR